MTIQTPALQAAQLSRCGVGLRAPHVQDFLAEKIDVGFLEVHSENYFAGGQQRKIIKRISEAYPLSLHGVGLSLGRADGLDTTHLRATKSLVDFVNPIFVSEHLSWSAFNHVHVPDLLPLPFTEEALDIFVAHITQFQELLGRQILIENPSNYLAFADLDYSETQFLNELVARSGCGLLLDVNNIAVSAHNLDYDAKQYIDDIAAAATSTKDGQNSSVKQLHLAGYQVNHLDNGDSVYLDTHGQKVYPQVWALYAHALQRLGDVPTLIEWDTDIPSLDVLLDEARQADSIRHKIKGGANDSSAR